MKKILLFIISLFFYSFAYSQYTVMLSGELNPNINQVYNYRIISGFHGVSGSKSTWKVTNGHFNNVSKSTTLTQDVDIMNVDVVWTGAAKSGQVSYSYSNGGVTYTGIYSVSIKGSGSSGGGDPETPGGGNGQIIGKTIWVEMIGPKEVPFNDDVRFYFPEKNLSDRTIWTIDPEYFDVISKSDITGVEKVITLRPKKKLGQTKIKALCSYFGSEIIVNIVKPNYKIENNTSIVCSNNTIVYTIKNTSTTQSEVITWQSSTEMTLVSGQGTPNATFRASGNEFGTVKATVIYDGISYQLENSQVWIGPPGYYASTDGEIWFPKPICIDKGIGPDNDVYPKLQGIEGNSPLEYKWTQKSNNFQFFHTTANRAIVQPLSKGDMLFTYSAKNQCGWSVTPQIFQIPAISCSGSGGGNGGGLPGEGGPTDGPLKSTVTGSPTSTSIKIYSFPTGSLVYKENKAINFNIQNTTLNAGIYIVETTDEAGNITREKVMKNKD